MARTAGQPTWRRSPALGPTGLGQCHVWTSIIKVSPSADSQIKKLSEGRRGSQDERGKQWEPASLVTGKQRLGRHAGWPAPRQAELVSDSDTHFKAHAVGLNPSTFISARHFTALLNWGLSPSVHLKDPIQLRSPFLKRRTRKGVILFLVYNKVWPFGTEEQIRAIT